MGKCGGSVKSGWRRMERWVIVRVCGGREVFVVYVQMCIYGRGLVVDEVYW